MRYLFEAIHSDGRKVVQTQDDVSKTRPTGSAFSDVEPGQVLWFILRDAENGSSVAEVDLRTGKFTVGGASFSVEDDAAPLRERSLVYFRRHWHTLNVGVFGEPDEIEHRVTFHIGYTGRDHNGVERQHTISIS